jgi:DNA mismatch repair protein MutS2
LRLEWPAVLERISALASSAAGAEHVRNLVPETNRDAAEAGLRLADEMVGLLLKVDWTPPPIPDVHGALKRLAVEGSVLDATELDGVARLLSSSRLCRADLRRFPDDLPGLTAIGGKMLKSESLERRLLNAFDAAGGIADSASQDLRRIRRALRSSRSSIVRRLETFARSLPDRIQVPDGSVTIRSGRYCIPVRREGMSEVGGIVHDESATHRTVFVEPPQVIQPMNRLAELEREEQREIARILRHLTAAARPRSAELTESLEALAVADSLFARARWALAHGGSRPTFIDAESNGGDGVALHLVRVHHPLLVGGDEPSVPFDLELVRGETVLLVSGPNAGGKTVLLKTVGLTSLLAQAGVIPPAGPGTKLPVYGDLFAVIGDEQSISASLSTFSAQVESVRQTLEEADEHSLVLLDEIGSSTDPTEGAALASAVLQRLAGQACLTVATTHLGALKALAVDDPQIVNASLQFDTRALRPTFRLVRDLPGRSYALEIAARLGLPREVLDDAKSRIGAEDRRVEGLLSELEKREEELAGLTAEAHLDARRAHEREERLAEHEERAARREKQLEREGKARAAEYLKQARREVAEEIERLRIEFRRSADSDARPESSAAAETAAAEVRSRVERLFRESRIRPKAEGAGEGQVGEEIVAETGLRVRSRSLGLEGLVVELRGDRAVLEAGGVRVEVPVADVEPVPRQNPPANVRGRHEREDRTSGPKLPEIVVRPEVDLRGLRVDEIEPVLITAVDAAFVGDLPTLRIIHGKGTFALRKEVARLLRSDRRVASLRPGGFEEGGSGVTVVEFLGGGD